MTQSTCYTGKARAGLRQGNAGNYWRVRRTSFLMVVCCLCLEKCASAQVPTWTSNGPEGGSITALAIDPRTPATLYAGTFGGGVYKSTDAGGSWAPVNSGLPTTTFLRIRILVIDPATPGTLYTSGATAFSAVGVFKSTNGGASWSTVNTGLTVPFAAQSVAALAIDPRTPTTLYAGTFGGLFKSTNGGGNWSPVGPPLSNASVGALTIDPRTPTTLYAGVGGSVFKSTNAGTSWSTVAMPASSPAPLSRPWRLTR